MNCVEKIIVYTVAMVTIDCWCMCAAEPNESVAAMAVAAAGCALYGRLRYVVDQTGNKLQQ